MENETEEDADSEGEEVGETEGVEEGEGTAKREGVEVIQKGESGEFLQSVHRGLLIQV